MKFEDRPDYAYLKNLIRKMSEINQLTFNYNKLDWFVKKEKMHEEQKENNKEKDKDKDKDKAQNKNSDDEERQKKDSKDN